MRQGDKRKRILWKWRSKRRTNGRSGRRRHGISRQRRPTPATVVASGNNLDASGRRNAVLLRLKVLTLANAAVTMAVKFATSALKFAIRPTEGHQWHRISPMHVRQLLRADERLVALALPLSQVPGPTSAAANEKEFCSERRAPRQRSAECPQPPQPPQRTQQRPKDSPTQGSLRLRQNMTSIALLAFSTTQTDIAGLCGAHLILGA
jgi:hypothetical protein